jgi:hypothetical protein
VGDTEVAGKSHVVEDVQNGIRGKFVDVGLAAMKMRRGVEVAFEMKDSC